MLVHFEIELFIQLVFNKLLNSRIKVLEWNVEKILIFKLVPKSTRWNSRASCCAKGNCRVGRNLDLILCIFSRPELFPWGNVVVVDPKVFVSPYGQYWAKKAIKIVLHFLLKQDTELH